MGALFLLQKDEICTGVAGESRGTWQRSDLGLREMQAEESKLEV